MRCVEKGCSEQAVGHSFRCSIHLAEAKCAHSDWEDAERADRRSLFKCKPIALVVDDDWRPKMWSRSYLRRPYRLFPSESTTWPKLAKAEINGTWAGSPNLFNEFGLWSTEYQLAHVELKCDLEITFKSLTAQQELIVRLRYGIQGNVIRNGITIEVTTEALTLDEIAEGLHISRERVRQVECQSLGLLHKYHTDRLLCHYGDQGRFRSR
jgi:hypothetical protein